MYRILILLEMTVYIVDIDCIYWEIYNNLVNIILCGKMTYTIYYNTFHYINFSYDPMSFSCPPLYLSTYYSRGISYGTLYWHSLCLSWNICPLYCSIKGMDLCTENHLITEGIFDLWMSLYGQRQEMIREGRR